MEIRRGNIFMTITELELKLPVYLDRIGKWRNQNRIKRDHGYPDYQWLFCAGGQGVLEVGEKKYVVGKGQGMFLLPREPHEYYAIAEPWEIHWLAFNGKCSGEMLRSLDISGSRVLSFANPDPILQKMYQLHSTASTSDPRISLKCSMMVYDLLLDLFLNGACPDVRSKQQYFEQLAPALRYVDAHYRKPITLDDLAAVLSVSKQYTCRLFQQTLGVRPFEYVTKIRLRKAKELLLQQHDLDIGEVAREVGYEHMSYFIKVFRREEGITPGQFRRK